MIAHSSLPGEEGRGGSTMTQELAYSSRSWPERLSAPSLQKRKLSHVCARARAPQPKAKGRPPGLSRGPLLKGPRGPRVVGSATPRKETRGWPPRARGSYSTDSVRSISDLDYALVRYGIMWKEATDPVSIAD